MNHDAAGKGLEGVEGDLEALAQFVGDLVPVVLGGHGLHHAARCFQRLGAGSETFAGQQRRHHAGAGCTTRVKWLGHGAELFAHADRLRGGNAQRHSGLLCVQLEQAGAGGRRAQRTGGAGDVPAAVIVLRVHGVADAAGHVDAQHQRVYAFAPAGADVLSQRHDGRSHRAGRVNDGFQVGVVKVKGMRGDAVEQRSAAHIYFFAATEYAGLRRGLQHLCGGQGCVSRFMVGSAHGATKPVGKSAVRVMVHRIAPAFGGMRGDKFRQNLRDGRSIVVGCDLGIAGHEKSLSAEVARVIKN